MENKSKISKLLSYGFLILLFIVVLGFVLRFYHLQFYLVPGSVDSVGYSYSAFLYSQGHWLSRMATPKGFLLVFFISLFNQILGPIFLSGKLVSLLFGGLLPLITYLLGKELFNKKSGLLAAFIVSINPLLILYSVLTFREILFSFTWMCCIYFAFRGFKNNIFYALLSGIFLGLSSMTIEIGIFAGIGFIIYSLIQKFLLNKNNSNNFKNLDILLFGAFLTMIPLFIRDYIVFEEPFASWIIFPQEIFVTPIRLYMYFIALSVPYVILFRILLRNTKLPSFNRISKSHYLSNLIKLFIILVLILLIVIIVGYFSGLFLGSFETLAAQSFVGFAKFAEYLILPEYLGLFLSIFSFIGITYAFKSRKGRAPILLCLLLFLFSHAVRAAILSNTIQSYGYSLTDLLTWSEDLQPITWPYQIIYRYSLPFIPLFSIFASYGILSFSDTLYLKIERKPANPIVSKNNAPTRRNHKKWINKTSIFKTGVVTLILVVILFQYFYAEIDLLSRAASHESYLNPTRPEDVELSWWTHEGGESFSLIDWLHSEGSPLIYSYNSFFKEKYGEDKVILLTGNENLLDIAKKAREDGVQYIMSDALGAYNSAQFELYQAGLYGSDPRFRGQPIGYYELVRSYGHWHQAQVFRISPPERTALVVQGNINTGAPWVSFLTETSPSYVVQTVDDEEHLTEYLTIDYDVIVLTEIRQYLENEEMSLLKEKVEGGTILIINGIAPPYLDLEHNGDWLGAKNFVEAPMDAKWNIAFTANSLDILSTVNLNVPYAFYSENLYSSPTGLNDLNTDVTLYATRVEDGAATIFAKPHLNGLIIFSGVRHTHASGTIDYELYLNFMQNLLNKSINKSLES